MLYLIQVRQSAENTNNGKPGKWTPWAGFASPIECKLYADKLRIEKITWDVRIKDRSL